jgi:hypothetical protein
MAAANRANVSIYTIDVSGLTMDNQTEAGRQMLATGTGEAVKSGRLKPHERGSLPLLVRSWLLDMVDHQDVNGTFPRF